jgi:hypothetical protein
VYHADPLACRQCGGRLKVIAYIGELSRRLLNLTE